MAPAIPAEYEVTAAAMAWPASRQAVVTPGNSSPSLESSCWSASVVAGAAASVVEVLQRWCCRRPSWRVTARGSDVPASDE